MVLGLNSLAIELSSYSIRLKSFEKARHPKSSHPVEIVNAHGLNGSTKTLLIVIKVRTSRTNFEF